MLCGRRAFLVIGGVDLDVLGMGSDDQVGGVSCDAAPLGLSPYFGAGLVIWDDGLRDVDVRLRPVFDCNVFLSWLAVGGSGGNSGVNQISRLNSSTNESVIMEVFFIRPKSKEKCLLSQGEKTIEIWELLVMIVQYI